MRTKCPFFVALIFGGLLAWLSAGGRLPAVLAADEKESAPARQPAGSTTELARAPVMAQEVLPFPPTPSASIAGRTMQESVYHGRVEPRRLPADAPNILIVLIDDAGPGLPSTYGGEVRTPTLDRIAKAGISYNRFHTTAMCSPTRAALLTGRNHHRVGNGQIAELANDWDGYSGVIPKSSATVAEVLRNYGYKTAAFGKWHNTPAEQTTAAGPFDYWPAGYGFEYFYGFLAGEASQYEPNLVRNTTIVPPPRTPEQGYHLTEDLTDDAIGWLRKHKAFEPDKPFFMYWASGAIHAPHHIMKEWADKYKGKFDDGWDNYRERVFKRAKEVGWIPANAQLTPRPDTLASWDSIPEDEKPFQRRLMEVAAGFAEHVDHHVGRIVGNVGQRLVVLAAERLEHHRVGRLARELLGFLEAVARLVRWHLDAHGLHRLHACLAVNFQLRAARGGAENVKAEVAEAVHLGHPASVARGDDKPALDPRHAGPPVVNDRDAGEAVSVANRRAAPAGEPHLVTGFHGP